MSTVYSTQFFIAPAGVGASYTCPAGMRAVLRTLTAVATDNTAAHFIQVSISPPATTVLGAWLQGHSGTNLGWSDLWDLHFVFNAGQTLSAAEDAHVDVTASGFLLTLP